MRLVYLGTPGMAVPTLDALVAAGHDVGLVVTGADKRRGRGTDTSPSPVKAAAERLGIPVVHTVDELLPEHAANPFDLGVVVAYGRIIRPHVLAAVPMVNLHFSLLPRWRGAAPVERALLAGDDETGVCVMAVEEGLDTGGVYARRTVPIGPRQTAPELRAELVAAGTTLLVDTLAAAERHGGLPTPEPQTGEPVYAAKIDPAELRIDWSRPAAKTDRLIRLGGAWTTWRGKRIKILAADLDEPRSTLEPTLVQPEGKPAMAYSAWRNGAQPRPGEWFE
ncbi:MAG TPA: methionyl-tRNA formyltransferase [Ilumatobacter sp.]|nr:methionyl-tRNA formyltransferase [Ilumatobacter sp.]